MTKRERKERQKIKKELQEQGLILPDKQRLNRKKFIEETLEEWDGRANDCAWSLYVMRAVSWVLTGREKKGRSPSLEAIGAAKVLKIALRLKQTHTEAREQDKELTIGDEYNAVKEIMEA